jgi:hypothetical protein
MAPTMNMIRNALSTGTTAAVKAAMISRSEPRRPKRRITLKARNELPGDSEGLRKDIGLRVKEGCRGEAGETACRNM